MKIVHCNNIKKAIKIIFHRFHMKMYMRNKVSAFGHQAREYYVILPYKMHLKFFTPRVLFSTLNENQFK